MLEKGRFQTIRKRREKILDRLSLEQKLDKGLIRKLLFEESLKGDAGLSPEAKEKIFNRALNRYFLLHKIGEKGNNTCLEAIHGQLANEGEIWNILSTQEKWKNLRREDVFRKARELQEKIIANGYPTKRVGPIIKELKQAYRNDKLALAILNLKIIFEDHTASLTQDVAEENEASYLVARKHRRILDPNREPNSRKMRTKERLEFGHGLHLAEYLFLQKVFKKTLGQEQVGEVEKPFLHISLHGKSDRPEDVGEIIIGNALRDGKMPCHPQIASWFAEELNKRIKESDIKKKDGEYFQAGVAIEGQRWCGHIVHCHRRYGLGNFKGIPLGENYQYIQMEMSPSLRQDYYDQLKNILVEILHEFTRKFSDKKPLAIFLQENLTEVDKNRLEGKLYYQDGLQETEEVKEKEIALGASLRRAFPGGLKKGDSVYVYNAGSKDSENRLILQVVSAKAKNRSEEEKIGFRRPAINSTTSKKFQQGNKEIIIEKKIG